MKIKEEKFILFRLRNWFRVRSDRRMNWHRHFVLWPVKVDGHYVWLEWIWRKGYYREKLARISPESPKRFKVEYFDWIFSFEEQGHEV